MQATKRIYLEIGVKLLGVYAAIFGATSAASSLVSFFVTLTSTPSDRLGPILFGRFVGFITPLTYFVVAYVLTQKTRDVVQFCLGNDHEADVVM